MPDDIDNSNNKHMLSLQRHSFIYEYIYINNYYCHVIPFNNSAGSTVIIQFYIFREVT